jgi:hypothetical protein
MKKFAIAALVMTGLSLPAFAQSATFEDLDADGSGELSYEEIIVIWPQMTQEDFAAADLDASSGLSAEEVGALQAGAATTTTMPAPATTMPAPEAPATGQ